MFWGNVETKGLREDIKLLQQANEGLKKEKMALREEVEELKLKKRLEQEEIRHMVKISEEKTRQEVENEKIALQKKFQEDISKFKEEQRLELVKSLKEFHAKLEKNAASELNRMQKMYDQIMGIMPKVNLMLEKKVR